MKKDYAPVAASERTIEESELIERTWTRKWTAATALPDPRSVSAREEYRLMEPFLARLPAGSRLLDGGCGLGEWTAFLSARGYDVTGIDLSAASIRRLETAYPQCRFLTGDIRDTQLAAGSFDGYFSWGTFEHFELGMEAPLAEAHRLLRPGGILFASVPFQNWRHILRDSGRLETWDESFDPRRGYTRPQRFYQWRLTRQEFRRELEINGFRVLKVTPFGNRHGVNRWLQWEGAMLGRVPLVNAIARRLLTPILPSSYIAHLIWAVAERRPTGLWTF